MTAFQILKTGMKEDEVRATGWPAARGLDQAGRAEQPDLFGMDLPEIRCGASAIYFDNGVVYHTN